MSKFNVKELHKESMQRDALQKNEMRRDAKNHLQLVTNIDVEKSYEASTAALDEDAEDYDLQIAHIESVLSAGPVRNES